MNLPRYFRLLPAVILVGGGLLVLKSVTLVETARAQTAMTGQAPAPEPKPATQIAVTDPTVDDSDANSAAEIDVLTSLSKRRQELDAREQSLAMQSNLITAAEQRVDGKIAALKSLQAQMQTLLGQRDAAEQAQLNSLVKTYSSMKPADAARIFNTLDETVQLNVAAQMKSDVLGGILSKMDPAQAQKLTVRLANRLKLPDATPAAVAAATAPEAPASQQLASVNPAATPAPPTPPANTAAPTTPPSAAPTSPAPEAARQAAATPPQATPAPAQPKQQAANTPTPAPAAQNAAPKPASGSAPAAQKQAATTTPPANNAAKAPPATAAKPKNG